MSAAPIMIVGCLLASGAPARAQSEDGGSHNGLQGTWRLQLTVRDCQTGQLPSLSTPPLGVWRHTGDHTYSAVSEAFVFSPAGDWIQTHRLTRAIQIGDDTDDFTDTVALQIFDTNGNLIVTGCGTTVATRFK